MYYFVFFLENLKREFKFIEDYEFIDKIIVYINKNQYSIDKAINIIIYLEELYNDNEDFVLRCSLLTEHDKHKIIIFDRINSFF